MIKPESTSKIMDISIVLVTYNSASTIERCIKSLRKVLRGTNFQLVVIDNNSKDETSKIISKLQHSGQVELFFKRDNNCGFAKSVNYGIQKSKGKYVFLVNPDIYINSKNGFADFLTYVLSSNDTIVGPQMFSRKNKIERSFVSSPDFFTYIFDFTNIRKLLPNNIWHRRFYNLDRNITKPSKVDGVSGAFMCFSRKVYDRLNGFDESFFMYLEDVDFCRRASELGINTYYYPGTDITHIAGVSSNNKERVNLGAWLKSRRLYVKKHEKNILARIMTLFIFDIDDLLIKIRMITR